MVTPVVGLVLFILVLFVGEAILFWVDQVHRSRERAYWARVRRDAPPLYDWERDGL